ncbi:MAG TPA: STAS domain-containing protein [Humibacillus sp.]|nr:STAS domain-containing protein [Humibacillus sp.]
MSELARLETRRVGETQLASISGEIDLSNARSLLDAIAAAVPDDAALVVLDLTATTYLDSAGIAAIFRLAERLRVRRQDLRLVVPPDSPIRAVLRLTHLDHVIQIDDTPAWPQGPGASGSP